MTRAIASLAFVTCGLSIVASARAQAPTPKVRVTYVRFWNLLPDPRKDALDLYLAPDQMLTRALAGSNSGGYAQVFPNTFTPFVQRATGGNNPPVKATTVRMAEGEFHTVVATFKDGHIAVEVVDDTIDPQKEDGSARLTVRQCYAGARAVVKVGATPAVTLNYGEVATLDHLPAGDVPVAIQATLPNGVSKVINVSGNYATRHHGSLLIVGDLYGRFRPFFTVDGATDPIPVSSPEH